MVFNNPSAVFYFIVIGSIWLVVLSIFVIRMIIHYNRLTRGITEATLRDVLTAILDKQELAGRDIRELKKSVAWILKDGTMHLQRLGIVRFNPFSDTGGSQSFSLAMMDGNNNGLVMTSLFARTGNRWYIKYINNGTCRDVELSKEEQMAIKKARPIGGQ